MNRLRILEALDDEAEEYYKQVCKRHELRQQLKTASASLYKHQELLERQEGTYAREHGRSQLQLQQIQSAETAIRGLEIVLAEHKDRTVKYTEKHDSMERNKRTILAQIQLTKDALDEPERIKTHLLQTIPELEDHLSQLNKLRAALAEFTTPSPDALPAFVSLSGSDPAATEPTFLLDRAGNSTTETDVNAIDLPTSVPADETTSALSSPLSSDSREPLTPNEHDPLTRLSPSQSMDLTSDSCEDIQHGSDAEENPNNDSRGSFTHSSQTTSLPRACDRCSERGFWCARSDLQYDRSCAQCQGDSKPCSFEYLGGSHSRKKISKEEHDKLADLRLNQKLSFKQIYERRTFGNIKTNTLRQRWAKVKSFYEDGNTVTGGPSGSSGVPSTTASDRATWACYDSESDCTQADLAVRLRVQRKPAILTGAGSRDPCDRPENVARPGWSGMWY